MKLSRIEVVNFRLLREVDLALEDCTTVIVGRNNSGKTSLAEVMHRLLDKQSPRFQLEDFSCDCHEAFIAAADAIRLGEGDAESVARSKVPSIELRLTFEYGDAEPSLGALSPFIVDLDPDCHEAIVLVRFELKDGKLSDLFDGLTDREINSDSKAAFFRSLRERVPACFAVKVWGVAPGDEDNRRLLSASDLRALLHAHFINAQRGLDDVTSGESDVLARTVELLFDTASLPSADPADREIVDELGEAVVDIQAKIDESFGGQLKGLIPALNSFGYPGLGDQLFRVETILDVRKLLSNFTKVLYEGSGGVPLPESYNGLGVRNLIFILLQIAGFYKAYCAEEQPPGIQLIFIEEPEAHLHPQMQTVFIRQLAKTADLLVKNSPARIPWPVQFVVSTHSSHVANEAGFESIRYFLAARQADAGRGTRIKDFRQGLRNINPSTRNFLHQYLTLTRCDLFFADKAVLVEGTSERLMLPVIIQNLEQAEPDHPSLSSQYVTTMEVGGAYAHLFFELLAFLELPTLVITDIDAVEKPGGKACPVHAGKVTSNACIKKWFSGESQLKSLLAKSDYDKVRENIRIAYQCPEDDGGPCGRSFEDAFILANAANFEIDGGSSKQQEDSARDLADNHKKSEFALRHAIEETKWETPRYVLDGIRWLASSSGDAPAGEQVVSAALDPEGAPDA